MSGELLSYEPLRLSQSPAHASLPSPHAHSSDTIVGFAFNELQYPREAAMEIVTTATGAPQIEAEALVIGVYADSPLEGAAEAVDAATGSCGLADP